MPSFRFLFVAGTALLLSGCTLFRTPQGGLRVATNQPATVYLDDKDVGETPLQLKPLDVKRYTMRLAPDDGSLAVHESSLKITAGFETTVEWTFGATKEESSGFIFESQNAQKKDASELEIITSPDNVPVMISNQNKGFSPLVIDNLPEGEYQLVLQAPGFSQLTTSLRLTKGKRMVVTSKLARKPLEVTPIATDSASIATPSASATPKATVKPTAKPLTASPSASKAPIAKPYIEVLTTPTGFLRVRSSPDGTEIGKLNVGDMVPC